MIALRALKRAPLVAGFVGLDPREPHPCAAFGACRTHLVHVGHNEIAHSSNPISGPNDQENNLSGKVGFRFRKPLLSTTRQTLKGEGCKIVLRAMPASPRADRKKGS